MTNDITVFLGLNTLQSSVLRNELSQVLESAGMRVHFSDYQFSDERDFRKNVSQLLSSSTCSVHMLEPQYGPKLSDERSTSLAAHQFFEAKKIVTQNPDFKLFVWHTPSLSGATIDPLQNKFINEVYNNIVKNIIFTSGPSPIQLVEDIRSEFKRKESQTFDVHPTDIFFIANELDESEANEIISTLEPVGTLEKLFIVQDNDIAYPDLCSQQIAKSKLAVIYFKKSGDWALSFTHQIWKMIGGALSQTPLLLIGDENPSTNQNKKISAPKIISRIVAEKAISGEIKKQFEKLNRI